jgi:glycosyltransferase involved in cell wall biosynthesis
MSAMRRDAPPLEHDESAASLAEPSGRLEELARSKLHLRQQLDELRWENQQLYAALDRYRYGSTRLLLRERARVAFWQARSRLRRLKASLTQRHAKSDAREPQPVPPYRVRVRQPVQSERPRILHVIGNFDTGGSAQLVVDLIERLGHRFEQEVVARDVPSVPAYVGFPLHRVQQLDEPGPVRAQLRRFLPDIVHVHYLGHRRTPYSTLDWRWYHQVFQAAEQDGLRVIENINIPVVPYVSSAVARYVYVSDYVKREFGRLDGRNLTIYPGSDLTLFDRADPAAVPDDCIGMVYRLEGDKLNEQAIDVFVEVVRQRPRTRVVIVGGGRYLDSYRQRVRAAALDAAFTFTGYVAYDELPKYLSQMSIFVAPIHRESFGQVTPFAMGMALPVAGYNVGAIPEILGSDALLAPPGDSSRLADIIVGLLDDRAARLETGARNRQRARERFSIDAMIRSYAALYEDVLQPAPR